MHAPFTIFSFNFWFYEAAIVPVWLAFALRPAMLVRFFGENRERGLFFIISVIAFLAVRLPVFATNGPLNPDEAQMAAQAIKATVDPWPWHGFDGATGGPLDSDFLALPAFLGLPISFVSTRILAAVLELLTSVALFVAFRNVYGETVARLALIAPLSFFIFTTQPDFVHYSSEHLPVFLIAVGIAALTFCFTPHRRQGAAAIVAGICLALVPFAKLQAAPEALYVFVIACILFARNRDPQTSSVRKRFFIASIVMGSLLVAATAATGSLHDAAVSYLINNVNYTRSGSSFSAGSYFSLASPTQSTFTGLVPLLMVTTILVSLAAPTRRDWLAVAAAFGMIAVSIYAINAAGHNFQHYFLLAILPIAISLAVLLGTLVKLRGLTLANAVFLPAVIAIVVLPSFWSRSVRGDVAPYTPGPGPVATALSELAPPHSRISIWGWMPEYYVYSQGIMATKDATTYNLIMEGPNRAFYRDRYLREFEQDPPDVFLEAVGPDSFAFHDRATEGFETFPPLAAFIGAHYRFVAEVAGARLYQRLVLASGAR